MKGFEAVALDWILLAYSRYVRYHAIHLFSMDNSILFK